MGSEGLGVAASPAQVAYFARLDDEARRVLDVARAARRKGLDPSLEVEIPLAEDLAARVEAQVQIPGIAKRIRELTKELKGRELVALQAAKEVAAGRFGAWPTAETALEKSVRAGLSILTEGILVAPLEGIAKVAIRQNTDGTNYVDLFFAGPIRAAGGTAQAMSVLIADVVRRDLGIGTYHPSAGEVERYKEEVPAYKRAQHLQYAPDSDEIELMVRHCPICINGEGTEKEEVTGHRDLPRVETNQLRGGAVLVLAEGLALKAPKIAKIVSQLKLGGWEFLETFVRKAVDPSAVVTDEVVEIEASDKFIKELIAGRPVLAHPSRVGGFRLRYGRSRTAGIASTSIQPITMYAVDQFLAVGTQMKIERPGKGTIATPCNGLEGPIFLLRNGDLVQPTTVDEFREVQAAVASITDLGEILIPFGEFNENNALLPDASFTQDWWALELEAAAGAAAATEWANRSPTFSEACDLSRRFSIPLHPAHNLFWHDLAWDDFVLLSHALEGAELRPEGLLVPAGGGAKDALVQLGALHRQLPEGCLVEPRHEALAAGCGFREEAGRLASIAGRGMILATKPSGRFPTLIAAGTLTGVQIRPRAPTRVGARMGRPEKADKRQMSPPVHVLFPVGHEGGPQRSIEEAMEKGNVRVKVGPRKCSTCRRDAYLVRCTCGSRTEPTGRQPSERVLNLREEFNTALGRLRVKAPKKLKGVEGLVSQARLPEPLEKGILRSMHDQWVFKDGTIRFDATDAPLTHFRSDETGTPLSRLRELGYDRDAKGAPLERSDQVIELRVQDVVLPQAAAQYFLATAKYIDDLLERFYGLPPFYQVSEPADLVGHLVAGLAPHTSGAVLGRIIGFTKANVAYAHPFYHSAKRRNCVAGDTEIFVFNSRVPTRTSLEGLWAKAPGPVTQVDAHGTEACEVTDWRVPSINPKTGRVETKRVLRVYRSKAPRHLIRVVTRSGRELVCTPDHPLLLANRRGVMRRPAIQAARAPLGVPLLVPFEAVDAQPIDLLGHLLRESPAWAVVRGIRPWVDEFIRRRGSLMPAAKALGVSNKALDNFRRRDSLPVSLLGQAMRLEATMPPVPAAATIGAKRNDVTIPSRIPWTPALMRFLGYYTAEGHSREKPGSLFQVSIAATEAEIRTDVERSAFEAFRLRPHRSPHALTYSSRALHFLVAKLLGMGRNAHEKRIPPVVAGQSDELTRELLRAYFSGDGHASKTAVEVTCSSVSKGLILDIGFQMARRGIGFSVRTESRWAGGAVREFLLRKGRPLRKFVAHRLAIRSAHARRFGRQIGFTLTRKQAIIDSPRPHRDIVASRAAIGDLYRDAVKEITPVASGGRYVYDIEVEDNHTFFLADGMPVFNCDGDEDAFMLLLDAFLNFSRSFVPDRRGGLMDLPLVLATRIDPSEIDKEALNLDVGWQYPLEFYRATEHHPPAKNLAAIMSLVGQRIGTPDQFEGFGYTVESRSIHEGPVDSAYKTLESMPEKMAAQLALADRIRAVDAADVAARVIRHHLLPDLIGNLKAFAKQSVRCTKCNTKYRRIPLQGRCTRVLSNGREMCGNTLTLTVHQASVRKYLDLCLELSERYAIPEYTKQHILLVQRFIDDSFRMRDMKLTAFAY